MRINHSISIAMATCNGEKYIKEQLDSLRKQTWQPSEIVIVDDVSTDNTLEIVNDFLKSWPVSSKIYINNTNLHYTGSFLKAASLCTGDVIAFCDQDDVWCENKIEVCVNTLDLNNADMVVHEGRVIDKLGQITRRKCPDLSVIHTWRDSPHLFGISVNGFAQVVRREVLEGLLMAWDWNEYIALRRQYGISLDLGHDMLVYAWCLGRKNISFVEEELVYYRVHGENFSANNRMTYGRLHRAISFFDTLKFDAKEYTVPAQKWAAAVVFLHAFLRRANCDDLYGIEQLANRFDKQSRLWMKRSQIYDRQLSMAERLKVFKSMLSSGSYVAFTEPNLGWRALFKDLVMAILMVPIIKERKAS